MNVHFDSSYWNWKSHKLFCFDCGINTDLSCLLIKDSNGEPEAYVKCSECIEKMEKEEEAAEAKLDEEFEEEENRACLYCENEFEDERHDWNQSGFCTDSCQTEYIEDKKQASSKCDQCCKLNLTCTGEDCTGFLDGPIEEES